MQDRSIAMYRKVKNVKKEKIGKEKIGKEKIGKEKIGKNKLSVIEHHFNILNIYKLISYICIEQNKYKYTYLSSFGSYFT